MRFKNINLQQRCKVLFSLVTSTGLQVQNKLIVANNKSPDPESIIIHLTIHRQEKNEQFADFLDGICINLRNFFELKKILNGSHHINYRVAYQ
jgi:hypothetical protein